MSERMAGYDYADCTQRRFSEAEARISEALALRVQLQDPGQERSRRALEALAEIRSQS